ncbi:P-loop containing nucleoside triphosphate hydrolase protein [Dothidotthia symphoricarpi CBS 119687]|uniref:P-loop containing nucleoside triphosphate hydrolase protein n=1 Tax=Dothidotthia symphoricarpi CBS 119687 TaxID=1392245 RepID=A0A6A5ZZ79_9PLEO|nr:P-loop containing nucleoside triphosphate hydrolase protein [Dothidotthia symphoricarpi CBS 119687]KAF2123621.1 P-loop containing nucleoside triphosphate hydrolase protein [Dothidotthia symphoricarpi CBS 119687]
MATDATPDPFRRSAKAHDHEECQALRDEWIASATQWRAYAMRTEHAVKKWAERARSWRTAAKTQRRDNERLRNELENERPELEGLKQLAEDGQREADLWRTQALAKADQVKEQRQQIEELEQQIKDVESHYQNLNSDMIVSCSPIRRQLIESDACLEGPRLSHEEDSSLIVRNETASVAITKALNDAFCTYRALFEEEKTKVSQRARGQTRLQRLLDIERVRCRDLSIKHGLLDSEQYTSVESETEDVCNGCEAVQCESDDAKVQMDRLQTDTDRLQECIENSHNLAIDEESASSIETLKDKLHQLEQRLEIIAAAAADLAENHLSHLQSCLDAARERRCDAFYKFVEKRGGIQILLRPRCSTFCDKIRFDTTKHLVYIAKENKRTMQLQDSFTTYTFDRVMDPSVSNDWLWLEEIKPLIENVFRGSSATLLAYGQTGSGKTYTMCERPDSMIPLTIARVFAEKQELEATGGRLDVNFSAVEVYLNNIHYLCHNQKKNPQVVLKRQTSKGPYVMFNKTGDNRVRNNEESINPVSVKTEAECFKLFEMAVGKRETRNMIKHGGLNNSSSRSHMVCTLHLNICVPGHEGLQPCIQLVDLAGSEEVAANNIEVQKEGIDINQSLNYLVDLLHDIRKRSAAMKRGVLREKLPIIRDSRWTSKAITHALHLGMSQDMPLIAFMATMHTQHVKEGERTCCNAGKIVGNEARIERLTPGEGLQSLNVRIDSAASSRRSTSSMSDYSTSAVASNVPVLRAKPAQPRRRL